MSAFDLSKISRYIEDNNKKIIGLTLNGLEAVTEGHVELQPNIKDDKPLFKLAIVNNVVQPYRTAFEPKVGVFQPSERVLTPRPAKVDLRIDPQLVQDKWLKKITTPGFNPRELPFEAFFMAELVKKTQTEINDTTMFSGVYNPAGTGPVDVANGFQKIIADAITAGQLTNVIATGAITSANSLTKLKQIYKALPAAWKKVKVLMFCSYAQGENYDENYAATRQAAPYNQAYEKTILEGSNGNCTIVRCGWLGNSNRIIVQPYGNMVAGTDLLSDFNRITVDLDHRFLDVMIEFKIGFQISDTEAIWVNDQV
jgi:hypothetical protein